MRDGGQWNYVVATNIIGDEDGNLPLSRKTCVLYITVDYKPKCLII